MLSNGNRSTCGFEDVMVSYIYDEIATAERRKFESHLVDCSACTDEFAAVSNARFSVFEWQREEFANLSTPEIDIPYEQKRPIAEPAEIGFLAGLRGLFSGFGAPVMIAAGLLISLGIGFAAVTFIGGSDQQIAANIEKPVVLSNEAKPQAELVSRSTENDEPLPSKGLEPSSPDLGSIKAVENHRPRSNKQVVGTRISAANQKNQKLVRTTKAPVLSDFDDNDDRSLRLADLFGGIGSKR